MKDQYYAHSREGTPPDHWHRLDDHLKEVSKMAQKFAEDFKAGDWAYLAVEVFKDRFSQSRIGLHFLLDKKVKKRT